MFVTNKYSQNSDREEKTKEIFFFKEGCVVFWNVPELERNSVLKFVQPFSEESYEESVVYEVNISYWSITQILSPDWSNILKLLILFVN